MTITSQDVYKGAAGAVECENIKGIQRVGNLWRIYPATEENRIELLTQGIAVKGTRVTLIDINQFTPKYEWVKLTIHGIPLSASDSVIASALRERGCSLTSRIERQLLRVDGKLTNC